MDSTSHAEAALHPTRSTIRFCRLLVGRNRAGHVIVLAAVLLFRFLGDGLHATFDAEILSFKHSRRKILSFEHSRRFHLRFHEAARVDAEDVEERVEVRSVGKELERLNRSRRFVSNLLLSEIPGWHASGAQMAF